MTSTISTTDVNDCAICYGKTSLKLKSANKEIKCQYCMTKFCFKCVDIYLMSLETDVPHCAHCKKTWSHEFLRKETVRAFYDNRYKKRRMEIKFTMEKALFPLAMSIVEQEKTKRQIEKEVDKLRIEEFEINQELRKVRKQMTSLNYKLNNLSKTSAKTYSNRVCVYEKCKGFIDNKGICGLCSKLTCVNCNMEKNSETHFCKPEDIESVNDIMKNTKPCPACGTRIYKIDGCDHFFCTKPGCETGFSWRTGQLLSDRENTNPHFYQFQARTGRGTRRTGDVICGGIPHITDFMYIFEKFHNPNLGFILYQSLRHNMEIELPQWSPNRIIDNTDLSVKFLMDEIDESKYKTLLSKRYKKDEKNQAVYPILEMYVHTMTEFFITLAQNGAYIFTSDDIYIKEPMTFSQYDDILNQMILLKNYVNEELEKVRIQFQSCVPYIDDMWNFKSIVITKKTSPMSYFPDFIGITYDNLSENEDDRIERMTDPDILV